MRISGISNSQTFKKLYYSCDIENKFKNKRTPKKFFKECTEITNIIKSTGADRKKYVDVILNHDDSGFYGVISSKKQGTPMHPDYLCKISKDKRDICNFENWVNLWNYAYSPKGLREKKELEEKARECLFNSKEFRKAIRELL